MEELSPDGGSPSSDSDAAKGRLSELAAAEAEIKKLKSELRGRESELAEARALVQSAKAQSESERALLENERAEFSEKSKREASELFESSRAAGHKEGFSEGREEGLQKAEADVRAEYEGRFSSALSLLDAAGGSLAESMERLALSHVPRLVRLWEMMLRKMLLARVDLDPSAASRVLGNILKRISDRERIMIYLNPGDIAMIEGLKDRLMDSVRGVKFFEFLSDDHVDRGSCLVETNLGIYDARWKTQLEQISSEVESLFAEIMASDESNDGDGSGAA
jgi:flagellar assembly protein FliH